jgi:hypothetical protein
MEIKKPLSEHQKRSLSNAITALSSPIFPTQILNRLVISHLDTHQVLTLIKRRKKSCYRITLPFFRCSKTGRSTSRNSWNKYSR